MQEVFQLVAIHSGSLLLKTNGQAESIPEKSVFFLTPGNKYDFYFYGEEGTCHSWIEFIGLSSGFNQKNPQRVLPLSHKLNCLIKIHLEYKNPEENEKDVLADIARATLKQFLYDLSQIDIGNHEQNRLIEKTIIFLKQNAQHQLNLDDIAGHACISKEHLCRLFKKASRSSPMSLFWQYKTEIARDLIVHTNGSFQEISHELSFSSPYHFSRKVKEITGRSPGGWRKGIV